MKIFGLCFVFAACALTGYLVSRSGLRSIEYLHSLISFVSFVRHRIEYFRSELPVIFSEYEDRYLEKIGFLKVLRESGLAAALEYCGRDIVLGQSEYRILTGFANSLGKSDAESQIRSCRSVIEALEEKLRKMNEEYPKQKKISQTLGILSGALLVILLI